MKKIITIFCVAVMLFTFGCSSPTQQNDVSSTNNQETDNNQQNQEETLTGTGDEISIEDIYCSEERDSYRNYQLKVRNNLDVPVDGIRIQCKLIDSSGDAIDDFEWLFTDIDAGTAEWEEHQINDSGNYRLSDAYAFKLYSFEVCNYDPWETLAEAEWTEPIIIDLSEIPGK